MPKLTDLFIEKNSVIHKIDGAIKLLFIILWTFLVFQFNDIRVFVLFIAIGFILLLLAKIPLRSVKTIFICIVLFTLFNSLFLIIITPNYGSMLTGTRKVLIHIGYYTLTAETLWYALTLSFKYIALLPITLIFLFTTHASKFASSLNRIGVHYKIAYSVSIALRYIPDVLEDFYAIKSAQQMKNVDFDSGHAFSKLKKYILILVPLVSGSIAKIDTIATGMELRCFGRYKQRTWYNRVAFQKVDYAMFAVLIVIFLWLMCLIFFHTRTFYYPFN